MYTFVDKLIAIVSRLYLVTNHSFRKESSNVTFYKRIYKETSKLFQHLQNEGNMSSEIQDKVGLSAKVPKIDKKPKEQG